jgi:three-Cys-motif partner protein
MAIHESASHPSASSTAIASVELQVNTIARYIDGLTRWFARYTTARRSFISLFSNASLIRNAVVRDLYKNACLSAFEVSQPFDRYIYASLYIQRLSELQLRYTHQYRNIASDVMFLTGDCNDLTHGIVAEATMFQGRHGDVPTPTVVFVNPDELRAQWSTIQTLAKLPHPFLVLFYPTDALERLMPRHVTSKFSTEVDQFFGGMGWRDLYLRTPPNARPLVLLNYYQEQLYQLGFREVVNGYDIGINWERAVPDARLYTVLFAQKMPLPRSFWDDLMVNPALQPRGTGSLHTAHLSAVNW